MKTVQKAIKHKIRVVSAASLFDGHDAAINIMRRILQSSGAEVIHLGHNRPVHEIVESAIQEDAQAIAVTSYQGGHIEFFKYMYDLLQERGHHPPGRDQRTARIRHCPHLFPGRRTADGLARHD